MTQQRKRLLDLFLQYTYLRTSHLYLAQEAKTDGTKRSIRRIIHDLWQAGHVVRGPVVETDAAGPFARYEFVYWLSALGLELAREHCPSFDESATFTPEKSPHSLIHEAAISDFHFGLDHFCAVHNRTLFWKQHDLKRSVNPDALFALTDSRRPEEENTSYYFLEIERSRQGNYRDGQSGLLRKLDMYAKYRGDRCLRDWQWFDDFRVIVVVQNEVRQRNLLAQISTGFPQVEIFLVTIDRADLTSPSFASPGDGGVLSLLE
jgi:hypothetical protein